MLTFTTTVTKKAVGMTGDQKGLLLTAEQRHKAVKIAQERVIDTWGAEPARSLTGFKEWSENDLSAATITIDVDLAGSGVDL